MDVPNAALQRLARRGSGATRGGRTATPLRLLAAGLVVVGSMTAAMVAGSATASASTVNGIATIANPSTLRAITSGASTTQFTVSLPPQASCDADTASHGYHVYSYLVPSGTTVSSLTFQSFPSSGYGLVEDTGTYYGPVNTAIGTGQIVSIPNDFAWGPLVADDGVSKSALLYSGSTGVWEAGLVCATSSGVVADNWNTEVTFLASTSDPDGFTWTAIPGPSGSAPATFTSAGSTTFTEGVAGSFTPTASGTPTPVITESGTLPSGVSFTGGSLAGTPTQTGSFPVTLTATNGIESPASQSFTLDVCAVDGFRIGTTSLPAATVGTPYSQPLISACAPSGATITWKKVALPKGFALSSGGLLTGTPSSKAIGSQSVQVSVTDAKHGTPVTATIPLVVDEAPAFGKKSPIAVGLTEGTASSVTLTAVGYPAPTFTVTSGTLPSGLSLDPTTGVLSGTPGGHDRLEPGRPDHRGVQRHRHAGIGDLHPVGVRPAGPQHLVALDRPGGDGSGQLLLGHRHRGGGRWDRAHQGGGPPQGSEVVQHRCPLGHRVVPQRGAGLPRGHQRVVQGRQDGDHDQRYSHRHGDRLNGSDLPPGREARDRAPARPRASWFSGPAELRTPPRPRMCNQ